MTEENVVDELEMQFQKIVMNPYTHPTLRCIARRVDRVINEELPQLHAKIDSLNLSYKALQKTYEKLITLAQLSKNHVDPSASSSSNSSNSSNSTRSKTNGLA